MTRLGPEDFEIPSAQAGLAKAVHLSEAEFVACYASVIRSGPDAKPAASYAPM